MRNSPKIRWFAILPVLAKPIISINSPPDPTMKARMFPLVRTPQVSVFYRIVVYGKHGDIYEQAFVKTFAGFFHGKMSGIKDSLCRVGLPWGYLTVLAHRSVLVGWAPPYDF